jgi:very-short-patch-repair endonuclease
MTQQVKPHQFRDAIANALAVNAKSYDLPGICKRYGMATETDDAAKADAFASKRFFVKTLIAEWALPQLSTLAFKILDDYDDPELESLVGRLGAGGVAGDFKNLIFAAKGIKPKIVFRDAINNDIEVVENEKNCLIYDRPLESHGLSWNELVDWWMAINGRLGDPEPAGRTLYGRLASTLASPPEKLLFKTYCALYGTRGFEIPALIPQVYLHYDPYVRRDYFMQGGRLNRQRMDFLLLLPGRQRVVIEVDGSHHYSDEGNPSPIKYSEMVSEDRTLRLAGYEVYRFGGYELAIERGGEEMLAEFFDRLLERYQLGIKP